MIRMAAFSDAGIAARSGVAARVSTSGPPAVVRGSETLMEGRKSNRP